MVATPTGSGLLDVRYTFSLIQSIRLCDTQEIQVLPVWIPYDALVQRARNDLFAMAYEAEVYDVVWIDDDQAWKPEDFLKLLSHKVDFVGCPVIKKTYAEELYNVKSYTVPIPKDPTTNLLVVDGIGTGFLRMSRRAIKLLWDIAMPYKDKGKERRMVFNVSLINGELQSEDNYICDLWKSLGEKVYVDDTINCSHIGMNEWSGDFKNWHERLTSN